MSCHVAADIDCDGQTRNMRGISVYIHCQRSLGSTKATGADTALVDPLKELFFQFFNIGYL